MTPAARDAAPLILRRRFDYYAAFSMLARAFADAMRLLDADVDA